MSESAPTVGSGAEGNGPEGAHATPSDARRGNVFARIALFVRQVVAELKKVVRPTRSELVNYTIVVIVFVAVVMAFVTLLDLLIGTAVGWIFGG